MNWKQVLGIVLGIIVVFGIVAMYDPSAKDDEITGALSWSELFGGKKPTTVGETVQVKERFSANHNSCDFAEGDYYNLTAGDVLKVEDHEIKFINAAPNAVLLELDGEYVSVNEETTKNKNGISICVAEANDMEDPTLESALLKIEVLENYEEKDPDELNCQDGFDDNNNGKIDCEDPSCFGQDGPMGFTCCFNGHGCGDNEFCAGNKVCVNYGECNPDYEQLPMDFTPLIIEECGQGAPDSEAYHYISPPANISWDLNWKQIVFSLPQNWTEDEKYYFDYANPLKEENKILTPEGFEIMLIGSDLESKIDYSWQENHPSLAITLKETYSPTMSPSFTHYIFGTHTQSEIKEHIGIFYKGVPSVQKFVDSMVEDSVYQPIHLDLCYAGEYNNETGNYAIMGYKVAN